jgi:biotin carboxylase
VSGLLIVGCGFPQLSLIRTAKRLGVRVIGCDLNPQAIGVADCDEFHLASTGDADAVEALVRRIGPDGITTSGSEIALRTTATVADRVGLPFHADPETIRRCQDKDAMRAAYEAGGVGVPPFVSCTRVEEARSFAALHAFPLVVKPARGWGQRGVARVDSIDELDAAFESAREHAAAAGLASVVVEGWLEGREYSVNGWIEDGALVSYCVTERLTVPGKRPLGVMIAEVCASGLSTDEELLVVEEARRGAQALGHLRGPCYSQVAFAKIAGGAPRAWLFETAARMGGGFDADVTRLFSGVDLYARIVGLALGDRALELQGKTLEAHGGAIAKFLIGTPGLVRSITGLEAARALPGVDLVEVFVPVGGRVHSLTDGSKRAGFALAHGDTRADATAAADAALATIRLEVAPDADGR